MTDNELGEAVDAFGSPQLKEKFSQFLDAYAKAVEKKKKEIEDKKPLELEIKTT